jgi:Holliday junction resolvasome RuvABC endonuclease subunit
MVVRRIVRQAQLFPILALDLGDTCGWAVSLDGRTILRSGIVSLKLREGDGKHPDEHPGARWNRIRRTFLLLMEYYKVKAVAWELIVNTKGGINSKASLFGTQAQVVEATWQHGAEPRAVAPGTLKKHATGNGRATKPEMRVVGYERWPGIEFKTHDEVDARWVLDWYMVMTAA